MSEFQSFTFSFPTTRALDAPGRAQCVELHLIFAALVIFGVKSQFNLNGWPRDPHVPEILILVLIIFQNGILVLMISFLHDILEIPTVMKLLMT